MKNQFLQFLVLMITLLLSGTDMYSYNIEVGSKYYNIISETEKTVELVSNSSFSPYTGDFVIPANIEYNSSTYTVTGIGEEAFQFSTISSLTIPATVSIINSEAFMLCQSLVTINNYASTPQTISPSTFYFSKPTLHVCEGLKNEYANASGWSSMKIIDDLSVVKATSLSLSATSIFCAPYESNILEVYFTPENVSMKDVIWSSSDVNIVYITKTGKFVGITEGRAVITARAKDGSGLTATCSVNVSKLTGSVDSYNQYLSSEMTGCTIINLGVFNKYIGFNFVNKGSDFVKVVKVNVINPNTDEVLATTTDQTLLGWVANSESLNLQVTIHKDVTPVYEWTYIYKDQEFVFRSDETYTSLDSVDELGMSEIKDIYSIDGVRQKAANGFNIIKMSDGSAKKIIVK